jgi:NADPH2:quinone reductase
MRVVEAIRFGGPEVLMPREVPDPVAGPGQVVVAVSAVHVLFLDTQLRRGWGSEYFGVQPPYVPGSGVAGTVGAVGAGVDPGWIGRRVVCDTGAGGSYAERAVVPAEALIPVPDELGLPEAAVLLHDGRTALLLADAAAIRPEEWVLVLGAGGGLGILLVQLAHEAGARVIGAARGQQKLDLARQVGADIVVDYTSSGWPEQVRAATGGPGPDVVFDGVGGAIGQAAFTVTARGGRFSAHGAPSGSFAAIDPHEAGRRGVTVRGIEQVRLAGMAPAEVRRVAELALTEGAAGRIRPVIGQTFPLQRAADAHAAMEARRALGATVLLIESV